VKLARVRWRGPANSLRTSRMASSSSRSVTAQVYGRGRVVRTRCSASGRRWRSQRPAPRAGDRAGDRSDGSVGPLLGSTVLPCAALLRWAVDPLFRGGAHRCHESPVPVARKRRLNPPPEAEPRQSAGASNSTVSPERDPASNRERLTSVFFPAGGDRPPFH